MNLNDSSAVIGIVTGGIGIAAVFCSSWASLKIAKRQLEVQREVATQQMETQLAAVKQQMEAQLAVAKNQIICPMRQAWINRLREKISAFISLSHQVLIHHQLAVTTGKGLEHGAAAVAALSQTRAEILLMLHKGEKDHDDIAALVEHICGRVSSGVRSLTEHGAKSIDFDRDKMIAASGQLLAITQRVLKREWEVTKRMESSAANLPDEDHREAAIHAKAAAIGA